MKTLKIRLISPKSEKALQNLIDQGLIQIIGNKAFSKAKPTPPVKQQAPVNFAKESFDELIKKIRPQRQGSTSIEDARKIIDYVRNYKDNQKDAK